jgi:hypothetical protein
VIMILRNRGHVQAEHQPYLPRDTRTNAQVPAQTNLSLELHGAYIDRDKVDHTSRRAARRMR